MSVRNLFKEDLLNEIVRVKPDELAPSLGAVILAIGEGRVEEEGGPPTISRASSSSSRTPQTTS